MLAIRRLRGTETMYNLPMPTPFGQSMDSIGNALLNTAIRRKQMHMAHQEMMMRQEMAQRQLEALQAHRQAMEGIASRNADRADQMFPLQKQMIEAQINKLNRVPEPKAESNLGKVLSDLKKARARNDSDDVKSLSAYRDLLAEGKPGFQATMDPNSGVMTFSQGGYGSRGGAQQTIVTDPKTGKQFVVSRPTPTISSEQQRSMLANYARKASEQYLKHPYIGGISPELRLNSDIIKAHKGDKDAAKRVATYIGAMKGARELETQIIKGSTSPITVPALNEIKQAMMYGWPSSTFDFSGRAPTEAVEAGDKIFQEIQDKIGQSSKEFFLRGMPVELDSLQPQAAQQEQGLPTFETKEQFHQYMQSLPPEKRAEVIAMYRKMRAK